MGVVVVSRKNVDAVKLPGRELQWLIDASAGGADQLSVAIMTCPPHSVVRPVHSHKDVEEIILILEGQGEAWVDGEVAPFKRGDAVLFPANSKHQVRNTGDTNVVTASIFATAKPQDCYVLYDEDAFAHVSDSAGANSSD